MSFIRNAPAGCFSDNAPGFLHAFIRTGKPVRTGIGVLEGRWIVGGLKESDYFDDDISNDVRSISAVSVVWRRRPESGAFLSPAIQLYRDERAKAVARGANITAEIPHDFVLTRFSGAELTSRPALRIGDGRDGCYLITPPK